MKNPCVSFDLSDKVYCADVHYPIAAIVTADGKVSIFTLEGQPKPWKQFQTKLTMQIRCIRILVDSNGSGAPIGFIVGGIEGRAAVVYFEENTTDRKSYPFKCHRTKRQENGSETQEIFPMNDMARHPLHHTVASVGGDGGLCLWDTQAHTMMMRYTAAGHQQAITAVAIEPSGTMMAYACGYDWSRGHEGNDVTVRPRLFLCECKASMTPTNKK